MTEQAHTPKGTQAAPEEATDRQPRRPRGFFKSQAWDWIRIILIILFIKGCLVDQYTIPSGSMEPTLQGDPNFLKGDRVLVNKWLYGPRIPFTTTRLWEWAHPDRWDIVVFKAAAGQSEHATLVKRVVGLPGERVELQNGRPVVNGQRLEPPVDLREDVYYYNMQDLLWEAQHAQSMQKRGYFVALLEQYPYRYGVIDAPEFLEIPEDHYFMLGDNSLNSIDGRHYGWVHRDQMLGPVFAIWWPWSHRRDFSGFTQTWWGQGLLYGLPLMLVLWEVYGYMRERRRRKQMQSNAWDAAPPKH